MDKLTIDSSMITEIKSLLESARRNVAQQVNTELLTTYWQIGRIIVVPLDDHYPFDEDYKKGWSFRHMSG